MKNNERFQSAKEQCERLTAFGGGSRYFIENGMDAKEVLRNVESFRQHHKMVTNEECNKALDSACTELENCLIQFDFDMNNLLHTDL